MRGVGRRPEHRGVEPQRHQVGVSGGEGRVEEGEALLGAEGAAGPGDARPVGGGEVPGDTAGLGPQAPADGGGGQTVRDAVLGEAVEEGVGGGVVALSGGAEGGGRRGEEDEQAEVAAPGQLVEVDRRGDLRGEYGVELFGRQRGDGGVGHEARRVHHTGERAVRRDAGEDGGERVAVRRVARDDVGPRARIGEFRDEFGGSRRRGAAPAEQRQVPYAVLGDQVSGDVSAEDAGAAGDEDGARGVEDGGPFRPSACGARQPRGQELAVAEGELGLAQGQGGVLPAVRFRTLVEVHQDEPVRVLRLGRPYEAPDRGGGGVDGNAPGGNGTAGAYHQLGVTGGVAGVVAQPGAQHGQRLVEDGAGPARHAVDGLDGLLGVDGQGDALPRLFGGFTAGPGGRPRHLEQAVARCGGGQLPGRRRAQDQ